MSVHNIPTGFKSIEEHDEIVSRTDTLRNSIYAIVNPAYFSPAHGMYKAGTNSFCSCCGGIFYQNKKIAHASAHYPLRVREPNYILGYYHDGPLPNDMVGEHLVIRDKDGDALIQWEDA